jgi:hypothetical protein
VKAGDRFVRQGDHHHRCPLPPDRRQSCTFRKPVALLPNGPEAGQEEQAIHDQHGAARNAGSVIIIVVTNRSANDFRASPPSAFLLFVAGSSNVSSFCRC